MNSPQPPAPAQQRRERHRAEARRAILDAAEALLVEDGVEKLTMRRLAARCGYTAPSIYHYFADKPGLLDALLEEFFARLEQVLQRVADPGDPTHHLRELIVAFVSFGRSNPEHYRLVNLPRDPERARPASWERVMELFEAPIEKLDAERDAPPGDPDALQQAMWALMHGLISLTTSRPDVPWVPRLDSVAIEAMLRGLRAAEGAHAL